MFIDQTLGQKDMPILEKLGLKNIQVSGVYPLPMISHLSIFLFIDAKRE